MPSVDRALHAAERIAAEHAVARDVSLAQDEPRRKAHGIVHTPPEVARGVLRVCDELVREESGLGLGLGLAEPELLLVAPACGPGAFIAAALAVAGEEGLSHAVGFDIDPVALQQASQLAAHAFGSRIELQPGDVLASELIEQRLRAHAGPLLIVGNPPWATARAQPTAADQARLAAFRRDSMGAPLGERKLGVLSDAYVRFFALCAQLARDCEHGAIVALVTNGSFLDGPVHRGMRAALLAWFDALYVLDLGGSALLGRRREQRDDNVFGVRPGVAISWLCRAPGARPAQRQGRAFHARMFGSRADKLAQLSAASLRGLGFAPLEPEPPALVLVPRRRRAARYASYPALWEWLPFHREGVQSNRDAVVVDADPARLLARLRAFCAGADLPELAQAARRLPHYDPARARQQLAAALERDPEGQAGLVLSRVAYRPFDSRWFCPVTPLCHRPRPELLRAVARGAAALVSVRKDRGDLPWTHAAYGFSTVDNCYLSARSSCRARAFPLYTPEGDENLAPATRDALAVACGEPQSAQQVQHYLLCVLSAACYRQRWDSELHQDYPRVPLPPDAAAFQQLSALGERLAALHASPFEATASVPEPPQGALHRDLQLTAAGVQLAGEPLFALDPEVQALTVGHHRPLTAYLSARALQALDVSALGAVFALAERVTQLQALSLQADRAVHACFGADW